MLVQKRPNFEDSQHARSSEHPKNQMDTAIMQCRNLFSAGREGKGDRVPSSVFAGTVRAQDSIEKGLSRVQEA